MGKTVYSRNPTTAKGTFLIIQLLEPQRKILEYIIRTLMKQQRQSKV